MVNSWIWWFVRALTVTEYGRLLMLKMAVCRHAF